MRSGLNRFVSRVAVLQGVLLLLLWVLVPGLAVAAEKNDACDRLLTKNNIPLSYQRAGNGTKVQEGLASIFSDNPEYEALQDSKLLHDGRIGPKTRAWVKQFCLDYPVFGKRAVVPAAVMESILHYREIAERYPDWKKILSSPEFEEWLHNPPAAQLQDVREIRRSGAAPVVIGLLDEFSASGGGVNPAGIACESLLQPPAGAAQLRFNLRSRQLARRVQTGLQAVFTGDPEYDRERHENNLLIDGQVGSQTRKWLARFCEAFSVSGPAPGSAENLQDRVVRSVLQYADIAAVHADWREVLPDAEFIRWILDTPAESGSAGLQLRLSGSAPIVNRLLAQYAARVESVPAASLPDECPPDGSPTGAVYYRLTEKDRIQLKQREAFIGQVSALQGQRFDSEQALDQAVDLTAYAGGDKCAKQRFLAVSHTGKAKPGTTYRLSGEPLRRIREQLTAPGELGTPVDIHFAAAILPALEELKDQDFASRAELSQLVRFKAQLAWEQALAAVQTTKDKPDTQEKPEQLPPAAEDDAAGQAGTDATGTAPEEGEPPAPPTGLTLSDEGKPGADVSTEAVPGSDGAAKDGGGQEEEPQRDAAAKVDALVTGAVAAAEKKVWPYEITEATVDALRSDAIFVDFPEDDLEQLGALLDVAYANADLYATAVRHALEGKTPSEQGSEPGTRLAVEEVQAIVKQARKTDDTLEPLDVLATEDCGCARRWDKVGANEFVVYGFYPSWLSAPDSGDTDPVEAGQDNAEDDGESNPLDVAPAVDFGIYNRIAYFSLKLRLNDDGMLVDRAQWSEKLGAAKLLRTAHRYLSEVDVVIEAVNWQKWNDSAIESAVRKIADVLQPEPPGDAVPDGVTLYFPGFDRSPAVHGKIVGLVTRLHKRLNPDEGEPEDKLAIGSVIRSLGMDAHGRAPALNILIDADRLELAPSPNEQQKGRLLGNLKYLGGLREILVGEEPKVDLMLVMLGQPVSDLKKKLRLAVENEFQGEERIDVLRKILPVMPPNGHLEAGKADAGAKWGSAADPYRQLHHDLVYFRDNFRGVAFWPAVSGSAGEDAQVQSEVLKERLIGVFSRSLSQGGDSLPSTLLGQDPCVYVCPNRLYLIALFAILLGILIPVATLAYWSCRLRSFIVRNTLPVLALVALLILMFAAFIACIPALNDHQDSILGALLLALITIAIFYYIRKVRQGPLP